MNVVEVVETVDEILDLGIKTEIDDALPKAQAMAKNGKCVSLLSCCNFVSEELYRDYAVTRCNTVVEAKDGFIDTADLKMCRALALADSLGNFAPFKYAENGLAVKRDGKYNLAYAKLPAELGMESEIVMPAPRITYRMFVYGVIAEFLQREGDYSKSEIWRTKLNAALSAASVNVCASMPVRRWL